MFSRFYPYFDPKEEERKREMGEKGRKLLEERLAKKAAEEANEA